MGGKMKSLQVMSLPRGLVPPHDVQRLGHRVEVWVSTTIVCSRLHSLRSSEAYIDDEQFLEVIGRRLDESLKMADCLFGAFNRMSMTVAEARRLFGEFDDLPLRTFFIQG